MARHILVQLPFSHYNERARWALDHAHIDYEKVSVLPFLHMPVVLYYQKKVGVAKTSDDKAGSPLSTPYLAILDGDQTTGIPESGPIMAYADGCRGKWSSLYPTNEKELEDCAALCKQIHDVVGMKLRPITYSVLLKLNPTSFKAWVSMAYNNVGMGQTAFWTLLYPLLNPLMRSAFKTTPTNVQRCRDSIYQFFEELSARLESRPYLCSDSFSAADLTLASLGGILLGITHKDGYGAYLPALIAPDGDQEAYEYSQKLLGTKAGQHILRMYAEHRNRPQ